MLHKYNKDIIIINRKIFTDTGIKTKGENNYIKANKFPAVKGGGVWFF
jgi:hypothetical protein